MYINARFAFLFVFVLASVITAALTFPNAAGATAVSCGQVITTSITVSNNLTNCTNGPALTIGADNVTLNLAGHTIDGTGTGVGILSLGNDNVTVTGGIVREFGVGIQIQSGAGHRVSGHHMEDNRFGIRLESASGGTIEGNRVEVNPMAISDRGIVVAGGQENRVRGNFVRNYRDRGEKGIDVSGAGHVVAANTLEGNFDGILIRDSTSIRIESNAVHNNTGTGIVLAEFASASAVVITGNTVTRNVDGILVLGSGPVSDVVVAMNNSSNNRGDGIEILAPTGVTVRLNNASSNDGWGIAASPGTTGRFNVASGNGNAAQCMPATLCI